MTCSGVMSVKAYPGQCLSVISQSFLRLRETIEAHSARLVVYHHSVKWRQFRRLSGPAIALTEILPQTCELIGSHNAIGRIKWGPVSEFLPVSLFYGSALTAVMLTIIFCWESLSVKDNKQKIILRKDTEQAEIKKRPLAININTTTWCPLLSIGFSAT